MESLSMQELQQALKSIVGLASCPVCLKTLTPQVALCVKGHTVCLSCRRRLQKPECPLCRAVFSNVEPAAGFIHQLIESLPHPCRHKDCDYFVKTEDNHELFCSYKPTKCFYCNWKGAENKIVDHLKESEHTDAKKYLVPLLGDFQNGMPFKPKVAGSVFTPILVDGHFFWGEMKNEPRLGKLSAIFHPVGNGKTSTVFKGSVKLNLNGSSYSADITLNMTPEVDPYVDNCISIPTSILHKYTVDDNLCYRVNVTIIPGLESLVTLVHSGIKSGIELLGTWGLQKI